MHRGSHRLPVLTLILALASAGVAGPALGDEAESGPPTIYKWVDENGIAHYTTELRNVPRSLRGLLGRAPTGSSVATTSAATSAASASRAAPTRSSGGADRWAETDRVEDYDDLWSDGSDEPGAAPQPDEPSPASVAATRRELDERIAELERDIASDEDALKDILSEPASGDTEEIAYHPVFREVAERLPKLLAELRVLEDERAQLDTP